MVKKFLKIFVFIPVLTSPVSAGLIDDLGKLLYDPSIPKCVKYQPSKQCSVTLDNGKYVGGWNGNQCHGKGYYEWNNGEKYSGDWKHHKRHGKGTNYLPNGEIYRGEFQYDKYKGIGTYTWVNGDQATGSWKDSKLNGFATLEYYDGSKEYGYFNDHKKNGKFNQVSTNGEVTIVYYKNDQLVVNKVKPKDETLKSKDETLTDSTNSIISKNSDKKICNDNDEEWNNCYKAHTFKDGDFDGDQYIGEWNKNELNGYGTYIFGPKSEFASDVYKGNFKDGYFHGNGTYTWGEKSKWAGDNYSGEWKKGMKDGQGIYTYSDGSFYKGEFKDDLSHGQGIETWAEGDKYSGEWHMGKIHGHGKYEWPNGNTYVGDHKNDKAHGYGKFTMMGEDGYTYIGEFQNDKFNGNGKLTYFHGQILEGEFKNDMFQGKPINNIAKDLREENTRNSPLVPLAIGTGFFINSEGYAITNNHVIEDQCQELKGTTKEKEFNFDIVSTDARNDIAIIKSKDEINESYLRISTKAELGEEVLVGGFPLSDDIRNYNIKITKGIVSALSGVENNFSELQIDAAIAPGNSGGPVVNSKGEVVAVTTYKIHATPEEAKKGQSISHMNFGKKSSLVEEMLNSKEIKYNEFKLWQSEPSGSVEIANLLSNTSAQIYCYNPQHVWDDIIKKTENTGN